MTSFTSMINADVHATTAFHKHVCSLWLAHPQVQFLHLIASLQTRLVLI